MAYTIKHRKVECSDKFVKVEAIRNVLISDVVYSSNIKDRYENNNLHLSLMHIALIEEAIQFDDVDFMYDRKELRIHLGNMQAFSDATSINQYEIGLDSGVYTVTSNLGSCEINTMSSGLEGIVEEKIIDGNICMLQISLTYPDENIMNPKEFEEEIIKAFGFSMPELTVMRDEELNLIIEEPQDTMRMSQ